MPRTPRPLADRFWEKVSKTDGCWIWTGAVDDVGYGRIYVFRERMHKAHRVAWLLAHGEWPKGQLLHWCDNPLCVRVDHLREGDDQENRLDMMARTTASHCRHGVERTPENTYVRKNGIRMCRCRQRRVRKSNRATWRSPDVAMRRLKTEQ